MKTFVTVMFVIVVSPVIAGALTLVLYLLGSGLALIVPAIGAVSIDDWIVFHYLVFFYLSLPVSILVTTLYVRRFLR